MLFRDLRNIGSVVLVADNYFGPHRTIMISIADLLDLVRKNRVGAKIAEFPITPILVIMLSSYSLF